MEDAYIYYYMYNHVYMNGYYIILSHHISKPAATYMIIHVCSSIYRNTHAIHLHLRIIYTPKSKTMNNKYYYPHIIHTASVSQVQICVYKKKNFAHWPTREKDCLKLSKTAISRCLHIWGTKMYSMFMCIFWSLGWWFEPTQGRVASLISPHCPLRLLGPV